MLLDLAFPTQIAEFYLSVYDILYQYKIIYFLLGRSNLVPEKNSSYKHLIPVLGLALAVPNLWAQTTTQNIDSAIMALCYVLLFGYCWRQSLNKRIFGPLALLG